MRRIKKTSLLKFQMSECYICEHVLKFIRDFLAHHESDAKKNVWKSV